MALFDAVLWFLVTLALVAGCYWLIVWVAGRLGFPIPPMLLNVVVVVLVLIAISMAVHTF
jgi:hypothetical protein